MDVRARRLSSRTDKGDSVSLGNSLSLGDKDLACVSVEGLSSVRMRDHNVGTVTAVIARRSDDDGDAVSGSMDRRTSWRGEIDAVVAVKTLASSTAVDRPHVIILIERAARAAERCSKLAV